MGSAGVPQSLSHTTDSQLDWFCLGKAFKCFPLNHSSVALAVCLGLFPDGRWTSVPVSNLWKTESVFPQEFPCISAMHNFFNSDQFPSPCWWKTSPQHDAVTTMLHCGADLLRVMRGIGFAPDIAFSLMSKKLHFCLIWPEYLLQYVWGVSHMPFDEHQTCLLIFFFKQWLFLWTLFRKAQLCGEHSLKWSYGQILQSPLWSFAAPSGLSLVSLLPLWLMPSLPGLSFGGRPALGRFVVVPDSFHVLIMDLMALWDVQSFGYFFL